MKYTQTLDPWQMLQILPGHVFWINRKGMYLGCNINLSKVLKLFSPKAIVGKYHKDLLPLDMAEVLDAINDRIMQSKKTWTVEEQGFDLDGNPAVYLSQKIPILDTSGEVQGLIGIALDITEKKQLEESLRKAKDQAEVANRAKSQFIGNMSHDLRTPLSGLVGMAEVIQHHTKEETTRKYATMMKDAGSQLAQFVDRILESCQSEYPKTAAVQQAFDLKEVLDSITALMQPTLVTKQLRFQVTYDPKIPDQLVGDREYCFQIILNLVSNAIKFTDTGRVDVRVFLTHQTKSEVELQLLVQDTGIGIEPEQHEIIFDSFSRLSPSCQHKYGGVGLGLFLVRQYLQRMGGDVRVESALGQGSTFICTLPFKLSNKLPDPLPQT